MTLVSLTVGKVAYDLRQDQYLEIKLPAEPAEETLVRAVGVPERLYYRLDFNLGPGQNDFRLPLADVIAPEKIEPEAFGIYRRRSLPSGQTAFIPIYARVSGATGQTKVVAVVRPGNDVSDVQWRRYAPGALPTAWVPVATASGLVPEGTRLEIALGETAPETIFEVSFLSQGVGRADRFLLLDH
jgi:hypothetical protein